MNGRDGMMQRLMDVFGVVPREAQLAKVRQEVRDAAKERVREPAKLVSIPIAEAAAKIAERRTPEPEPEVEVVVDSKPNHRKKSESIARRAFVVGMLRERPRLTNAEIVAAVKNEFDVGMCHATIRDIRADLGIVVRAGPRPKKGAKPRRSKPKPKPKPKPQRKPPTDEDQIRAALGMLLEDVPGLRFLRYRRLEDGTPDIEFEVEAVRRGKVVL